MNCKINFSLIFLVLFATSCVSNKDQYHWGSYQKDMHGYYKNEAELEAIVKNLDEIMLKANKLNKQVPPAIYAEYGYLMLEQQNYDKAISYFEKEKDAWPQSSKLMKMMIKRTKIQQSNSIKK